MRLSIGPCLFDWSKEVLRDYYKQLAFETEADVLYIGEVVCSKRYRMEPAELLELAQELSASGKEVVLSTLGLVMSEMEQVELRQIAALARNAALRLEVNDMAGMGVGEGQPMVAGPHIMVYNPETLSFLKKVGVERVVLPVELSAKIMAGIMGVEADVEVEVFAYGKLPLTFSARCYTARAFHLSKANCQYKCSEFADGMMVRTQDGEALLVVNGTETMSARVYNLVQDVEHLRQMGVSLLRLSPQSQNMKAVVQLWKERVTGRISGAEALARLGELNGGEPFCNGYFHGRPGLEFYSQDSHYH